MTQNLRLRLRLIPAHEARPGMIDQTGQQEQPLGTAHGRGQVEGIEPQLLPPCQQQPLLLQIT